MGLISVMEVIVATREEMLTSADKVSVEEELNETERMYFFALVNEHTASAQFAKETVEDTRRKAPNALEAIKKWLKEIGSDQTL